MTPALHIIREMTGLTCFFCGVDSTRYVYLFLAMFGSGVIGGGFLLFWSISNGDFKDAEQPKYDIFNFERKQ